MCLYLTVYEQLGFSHSGLHKRLEAIHTETRLSVGLQQTIISIVD